MVLKLFLNQHFFFLFIGEIVAGIGSPYVNLTLASFADHWYEGKSVSLDCLTGVESLLRFSVYDSQSDRGLVGDVLAVCVHQPE